MILLHFILGLVAGSFGNVLVHRLPRGLSLRGRSVCPSCKEVLRPQELIPLFSVIIQRGRCTHCSAPISWQYPSIELASGLLFALAYHVQFGATVPSLLLGVCLWLFLLIGVIDGKHGLVPDGLSASLILLGGLYAHITSGIGIDGIVLGAGFFGVQWLLSRGAWVGTGDILLGAGIGAFLASWKLVALCLMFAYILGGLWALFLLATNRATPKTRVPFGPFLALATLVVLLMQVFP